MHTHIHSTYHQPWVDPCTNMTQRIFGLDYLQLATIIISISVLIVNGSNSETSANPTSLSVGCTRDVTIYHNALQQDWAKRSTYGAVRRVELTFNHLTKTI